MLGSGDYLVESGGQDVITAAHGKETAEATAATSDLVRGGSSDLVFMGGTGSVTIHGGSGSDTFFGGAGDALVRGGNGDQMFANGGIGQALHAGGGNETLNGSGSSGRDQIIGGQGDDTFVAGRGAATIDASLGRSTFIFINGRAGGTELVQGLLDPSQLKISLSGYRQHEENYILKHQASSASGVTITLSDHTTVTFENIAQITRANFAPASGICGDPVRQGPCAVPAPHRRMQQGCVGRLAVLPLAKNVDTDSHRKNGDQPKK